MGGGVVVSSHGKDYPGKLTCKVLVICIVAAMGGLIFGYDLGISGNNIYSLACFYIIIYLLLFLGIWGFDFFFF
jgi:hypothetical protein